jgi:hypothetical protein
MRRWLIKWTSLITIEPKTYGKLEKRPVYSKGTSRKELEFSIVQRHPAASTDAPKVRFALTLPPV